MNLTLSIGDSLLKEARKAALEKDTTVNALVREYLQDLVEKNRKEKTIFLNEWERLMDENPVRAETITWSRDGLHER